MKAISSPLIHGVPFVPVQVTQTSQIPNYPDLEVVYAGYAKRKISAGTYELKKQVLNNYRINLPAPAQASNSEREHYETTIFCATKIQAFIDTLTGGSLAIYLYDYDGTNTKNIFDILRGNNQGVGEIFYNFVGNPLIFRKRYIRLYCSRALAGVEQLQIRLFGFSEDI